MTGTTFLWILILGIIDVTAVIMISRFGTVHPDPTPEKPEESHAVVALRKANAERLAKIEAGRAKALPSGEAKPS